MGMRYEHIKTAILVVLVASSLIMTYHIWTYQPSYKVISKNQHLQEVEVSSKSKIEDHILPTEVLYHRNDNHYMSHDEDDVNKWVNEMKKWKFSNVTDVSDAISLDGFLNYVHGSNSIEVLYPDALPLKTFQQLFSFSQTSLPNQTFDRVLIKIKRTPSFFVSVYLVNYEQKKIYSVTVKNLAKDDIKELEDKMKRTYAPSLVYKENKNRYIFLPENNITMNSEVYYTSMRHLDIEKYKEALFNNPDYARKETSTNRDVYTEGTKVINVNTKTDVMEYVNLVNSTTEVMEDYNLINRSFSFVNDHGGWTESNYRFNSWNRITKEISYRYYKDNYPVYSNQGMTEIYQRWGNAEILNYRRPLYRFVRVQDSSVEKLQSSQKVIQLIEKHQNFDPNLLKDISIGYQLEEVSQQPKTGEKTVEFNSNSVKLVPSWFYYYNSKWYRIAPPTEGGDNDGLE
ncbi:YycH family regulatory protein [Priestia aryabhattai]|uniref:YycH family regulatory protein n=1 Tax=Priestia aryabhattai TaxID=412384 RepID=UPI00366D31DE